MKNLVLSATILFSASQAHAGPFDGTYLPQGERDNGATCQSLNGIFDGKTPYRIEEGWIEYMESGCKLSKPKALSDGSVRYQASCATEGTEFREKLTISPASGGVTLKGDGWQEYWQLCSTQQQTSVVPQADEPADEYKPNEVRCYMDIRGKVIVDGPCVVDMNAEMVTFDSHGNNISHINTDGRSMSAWNGGSGYRVTTPLGVLTKQGDYCYTNQNAVVCFGMPK